MSNSVVDLVRFIVNVIAVLAPSEPSTTTEAFEMLSIGTGVLSAIVPVADEVEPNAATVSGDTDDIVTVNVSLGSSMVSVAAATVIATLVSPAVMVAEPSETVVKSAVSAVSEVAIEVA